MTEELKQLYRELGDLGPLPGDDDEPGRRDGEPGPHAIENLWRDQPEAVL